jgi:hypothetical protein
MVPSRCDSASGARAGWWGWIIRLRDSQSTGTDDAALRQVRIGSPLLVEGLEIPQARSLFKGRSGNSNSLIDNQNSLFQSPGNFLKKPMPERIFRSIDSVNRP